MPKAMTDSKWEVALEYERYTSQVQHFRIIDGCLIPVVEYRDKTLPLEKEEVPDDVLNKAQKTFGMEIQTATDEMYDYEQRNWR